MGLRSKLLIAGAAASLVVAGSVGLAGASEDLPAGDYTIEVPGVGTVAFAVDTDGDATVTALPEGFTLAADEEVEAEDLALTVDGTVYEVEFEAENDDDEGLTTEIEGEARDDDEDETHGPEDDETDEPDDDETDGPDDDETDGPDDDETDEPDDDETDEPEDDETDGPDDDETDGPDDDETEDDEDDEDED